VLISCDGYNVYRSDRVSHGGVVTIYVNKKLEGNHYNYLFKSKYNNIKFNSYLGFSFQY